MKFLKEHFEKLEKVLCWNVGCRGCATFMQTQR